MVGANQCPTGRRPSDVQSDFLCLFKHRERINEDKKNQKFLTHTGRFSLDPISFLG